MEFSILYVTTTVINIKKKELYLLPKNDHYTQLSEKAS